MRVLLLVVFLSSIYNVSAQRMYGVVYNRTGDLLPFSSIIIKGSSTGASANERGKFSIKVNPGSYTLVCQHIGYASMEKSVLVTDDTEVIFILDDQKLTLEDVLVKSNGEDPAYAIIRNAIKKRIFYDKQVTSFACALYGKDMIKLRALPKKIFGKKIPLDDRKGMGLDSSGKGIIYLSESVSKVFFAQPDKLKLEVNSSRVSGSGGFGFTFPSFISLYKNNVTVFTDRFNPRGFISPISDGAISFYKFKFLGNFWEDGKAVNVIRVTPRRTYEPLFSGIINITDDDWRIHSFDLLLTKSAQLEILDSLQITQLYVPVSKDLWRVKNQLLHFNFNQLGIDALGDFVSVYSNYNLSPGFGKKFFDRVIIKYDTAVNRRPRVYWDSIRPVPLEHDEEKDYAVKDSIYQSEKDSMLTSHSIDSLNKKQGHVTLPGIFLNGVNKRHYSKSNAYSWGFDPLLPLIEYNNPEGVVLNAGGFYSRFSKALRSNIRVEPNVRYGLSNTHLNASANIVIRSRDFGNNIKLRRQTVVLSGGKRVSEFNKGSSLSPLINSVAILLYGNNYIKTYENYYGLVNYSKGYESGLRFSINALFENRYPLANTSYYTFQRKNSVHITANYPGEVISQDQNRHHQAAILSVSAIFKPGQRYIQFPYSKMAIGSKYPTFSFAYSKGLYGVLGSNVDFDKWNFSIYDDKNLKLAGLLKYRISVGGFLNNKKVFIQDYQHFNGNRTVAASEYVNSFQLASYYQNSTTTSFYSLGHVEHHFNGLLTNKIPLFKRLNWNLVAGSNAFYVNKQNSYVEFFAGLENVLKVFRVDFLSGYENGKRGLTGIRVGSGGLVGSSIRGAGIGGKLRGNFTGNF